MKVQKILSYSLLAVVAGVLSSCSSPEASQPRPLAAGDNFGASENRTEAVSYEPKKTRTGIATGWGRVVKSEMGYRKFERSSAKPKAVSVIRYNDSEGAKAMGLSRSYKRAGMQSAGKGLVEWGMSGGLTMWDNYWWRGDRFVIGKKGREYQIQVKNLSDARLEVVLSVDGLDVMDGESASTKKRGYLIEPGKRLTVKGFRTSEEKVATFKFSSVDGSYSNLKHGATRNVGVVGMALFTEKGREPGAEGNRRGEARAFADAPPVKGR